MSNLSPVLVPAPKIIQTLPLQTELFKVWVFPREMILEHDIPLRVRRVPVWNADWIGKPKYQCAQTRRKG